MQGGYPEAVLGRQGVDFDQGVAGSIVFAPHNGGSNARWPGNDDGGFVVVGRRFSRGVNL